jgi:mannose-6-phosphate isomerase-like protein (cupin superfamily)
MAAQSFEAFAAAKRAAGFDESLVRRWEPDVSVDTHAHGFDADALVIQGEMWLTRDGQTLHLGPGDTFQIARGTAHSERYGPQGATYWVARRKAPATLPPTSRPG